MSYVPENPFADLGKTSVVKTDVARVGMRYLEDATSFPEHHSPVSPVTLPTWDYIPRAPVHPFFRELYRIPESDPVEVEPAITISTVLKNLFGLITIAQFLRTLFKFSWKGALRRYITYEMGSAPPFIHNYRRLRDIFNTTEFFKSDPFKDHSHGRVASERASAKRFMHNIAVACGMEEFSFQMAKSDQDAGLRGERSYFWARDVSAEPRFDALADSDMVTLIDVDYYMDMPQHLCDYPRPHLVYTVVPETAAASNEEYSYHFDKLGQIVWNVKGGAKYVHRLWHYGTDWFTVCRTRFGIPWYTVTYDLQARRTSENKQVILMTPMREHFGVAAILSYWMGKLLSRVEPVVGDFAKVKTFTDLSYTSVARLGMEASATIPSTLFDSLLSTRNNAPKQQLSAYQVKSLVSGVLSKDDVLTASPILTDYLNNAPDRLVDPFSVVETVNAINFSFAVPDPKDKPAMVPFASPLITPAFVPMKNAATGNQAIVGRVLQPRADAMKKLGEFKMTPNKQRAVAEFALRLFPNGYEGVPYSFEEVAEKQTKPRQKRDLTDAGQLGTLRNIVSSFMKGEAYGKFTDPRNITTFNPIKKIDYAHFMYPLMDAMKSKPYYAFGRTPRSIAERVAAICSTSAFVICPDISRMDGYVAKFARAIERTVGLRFFRPEHHEEFVRNHEESFGNKGITADGLRYLQEYSRGSGEMGTSVWNTIINLFIIYYAFYIQEGCWDIAWKKFEEFTLAGGDDGMVGELNPDTFERAARDTGFIVKVPVYRVGDHGVNFLARVYGPDVWGGSPNSMCSIRRQLEKFHLSPHVPLSSTQKLYEKSLSFSFTDKSTPLIGPLVTRVLASATGYTTTKTLARWGDDNPLEDQYPNYLEDWMWDICREELEPDLDIVSLERWIDDGVCRTMEQWLEVPQFYHAGREFNVEEPGAIVEPGMIIKEVDQEVAIKQLVEEAQGSSESVDFSDICRRLNETVNGMKSLSLDTLEPVSDPPQLRRVRRIPLGSQEEGVEDGC